MGQPYLLVDPLERLDQLRDDDPSWVHTPGGWWRGDRHPSALWRGEDRQEAFERALALTSSQEGP